MQLVIIITVNSKIVNNKIVKGWHYLLIFLIKVNFFKFLYFYFNKKYFFI